MSDQKQPYSDVQIKVYLDKQPKDPSRPYVIRVFDDEDKFMMDCGSYPDKDKAVEIGKTLAEWLTGSKYEFYDDVSV